MPERTGAKAARLVQLMMMLKSRRYTVDELAEIFDTETRTIYRDFEVLRADFNCVLDPDKDYSYQIDPGFYMPALALTETELVALLLACKTLGKRGTLSEDVQNALAKLRANAQTLAKKNLAKVEEAVELAPARGAYAQDVLKDVLRAYNEEKVVEMLYHSRERTDPVSRRVAPWGFFFFQELWYVVGHDYLTEERRQFRLDRVRALTVTEQSYERPKDFDPSTVIFHRFDVGGDKPVRVLLRVNRDLARYLSEIPGHDTQKLNALDVEYRVKSPLRMAQWLLGLGPLEVLEPPELRAEVARLAGEILRSHK